MCLWAKPTMASSSAWHHCPANPGLKAHGRDRGGATMVMPVAARPNLAGRWREAGGG
jgi:hypothetical protein